MDETDLCQIRATLRDAANYHKAMADVLNCPLQTPKQLGHMHMWSAAIQAVKILEKLDVKDLPA